MVLIDTSAWIEFLRRGGNRSVADQITVLLDDDEAGPIRSGLRSQPCCGTFRRSSVMLPPGAGRRLSRLFASSVALFDALLWHHQYTCLMTNSNGISAY